MKVEKKILVVDDDPDILEPIALLLEAEGYDVATISRGGETYQKIQDFKPNVVLLDILMSGSDGRKICKHLKEQKNTQKIPIIMMSAHPSAKRDAAECGADDFIAKPFETEDLLRLIKKHVGIS